MRLGRRLLVAAGWLALGGIPGVFTGLIPWLWFRIPAWLFALVSLVHLAVGIANLIKNRGVLLRLMGTGSIEWPASYQERWLRRPVDWVEGPEVVVSPEIAQLSRSRVEPRVTLVGGTRTLRRLPLYGTSIEDFAAAVNAAAAGRGLRFTVATLEDDVVPEDSVGDGSVGDDEGKALGA
jgi:hypothetical protein